MHIELRVEGKTVLNGEVDLRFLVNLLNDIEKDIEQEGTWASTPIDVDQAKAVINLLDKKTVELLRWIVIGGGSITWPKVQEICGIKGKDFAYFRSRYQEQIRIAVRTVTQGQGGVLIWWEEDAPGWDTDDWRGAKLEIDGPALKSLKAVLIG